MKTVLFDNVETIPVRCSVREFVEFLLRSGDLDNRSARKDPDTMKEGAEMHRRIQKEQGSFYEAEVSLSHTCLVTYGRHTFSMTVEGRADGILQITDDNRADLQNEALIMSDVCYAVDEIKSMLRDVRKLTDPVPEHLAQAKCYAYFYCVQEELDRIAVQMTYVTLESGRRKYFTYFYTKEELAEWFFTLCREYAKFEEWQTEHALARDASIRTLAFPFDYRPGQDTLVKNVYRTILRERKLFLEAPTGVGKTISTVFPAIKSMGEGLTEKIFYLTAKTITRTVAEETFTMLTENGLVFLPITITAKEKLCVLPKPDCNPTSCPRAKGHFDRVNEAIYAMLSTLVEHTTETSTVSNNSENCISHSEPSTNKEGASIDEAALESTASQKGGLFSRELIQEFADRYQVCPYEMSLDVALFADAVICDYNYAFDPTVYFRRFFGTEIKHNYTMLVDEAHNLVERAREMYSAMIIKDDFLEAKHEMEFYPPAVNALQSCNRAMLKLRQQHERFTVLYDFDLSTLIGTLERIVHVLDEFTAENTKLPDLTTDLYFAIRHFLAMYEDSDDHYRYYCDYTEDNRFFVRIQCMDPSRPLERCLSLCRSTVFFSATFLPIRYYKDQLSGAVEDYAVYADSPFDPDNRLVMIATDVSTRYQRRTDSEYHKVADYIMDFCTARQGNYMVFFPSYRYMQTVASILSSELLPDSLIAESCRLLTQQASMSEKEREEFLANFNEVQNGETLIGLCVMGGIFSEGIDLTADRLIGAVIVGPGLPMVCNERELFREYYQEQCEKGFEYAYLYPGMNKVLQSGGRVIRTTEDVGAILLLDDRFRNYSYRELFPNEWSNCHEVNRSNMLSLLKRFWDIKNQCWQEACPEAPHSSR